MENFRIDDIVRIKSYNEILSKRFNFLDPFFPQSMSKYCHRYAKITFKRKSLHSNIYYYVLDVDNGQCVWRDEWFTKIRSRQMIKIPEEMFKL